MSRTARPPHVCRRPRTCNCSIQGLEPADDCPIHSGGEWPPRCEDCGRFLPHPEPQQAAQEIETP